MPKFVQLHRNKYLTVDATSLPEMIAALDQALTRLKAMQATGLVTLRDDGAVRDDYAHLVTDDPAVAKEFGFVPADEYFGDDTDVETESDEDADQDCDDCCTGCACCDPA